MTSGFASGDTRDVRGVAAAETTVRFSDIHTSENYQPHAPSICFFKIRCLMLMATVQKEPSRRLSAHFSMQFSCLTLSSSCVKVC